MHQRGRDIGWMSQSRMPLPARCAEEVADRTFEFCGYGSQCRKASQIALTLELVFASHSAAKLLPALFGSRPQGITKI